MTREQLIEVMAKAECLHDDPKCNWEALPERHKDSYRESQAAILDALTAAGMVVVPRAELEWVQQRCNEASPSYSERDILHDIHAKVRAMTEAANAE